MSSWSGGYFTWAPRKTAGARRADAARLVADAARRGVAMSPVAVAGRKIATTFWGKAWCDNLERYRDFAYRLERGRSYLRSGSVIDLRIEPGKIAAAVSGSSLYDVAIEIDTVGRDAWRALQRGCAGGIGSRIDLLAGKLSEPVMARLCADRTGLFPDPSAIRFRCSCPDHATMCKHVAAAMYGVGARLDHAPELLFTLRRVSLDELLAAAVTELPAAPSVGRVLASNGLAALFGIELTEAPADPAVPAAKPARGRIQPSRTTAARGKPAAAKPEPARGPGASKRQTTARVAAPPKLTGGRRATATATALRDPSAGPARPARLARLARPVGPARPARPARPAPARARTSAPVKTSASRATRPSQPTTKPAPRARRRSK
jgi:uncharacterized Zn finger protein